jgi:ankyrin repeat protein
MRKLNYLAFMILTLITIMGGGNTAMAANKAEMYFEGLDLEAVKALEQNDDARLQRALAAGADVNRPGRQGVVPFLYFIASNNATAMVHLYKRGARFDYELPRALGPKFPENFGWVPANPNVNILKALLEAKLDPNYRPQGSRTLIFWTINPFNQNAFELLLSYGANINAQDALGRTILHKAIQQQDYKFARFLLGKGADPNIHDSDGSKAFDLLQRHKSRAAKGSPIEKEIDQLMLHLGQRASH